MRRYIDNNSRHQDLMQSLYGDRPPGPIRPRHPIFIDKGWAKVCVANIYPQLYSLLLANDLWRVVYKRPPEILVE